MRQAASDTAMGGEGAMDGIAMTWSAKRPAAPPAAPTRHEFTPTAFYREFSSSIQPVLRIFPGDSVHTKTVDAGGRDETGRHRVFGGNPETGPFYVEGAMPGDTLVVKLTRVRLNRDSAFSGDRVVPLRSIRAISAASKRRTISIRNGSWIARTAWPC